MQTPADLIKRTHAFGIDALHFYQKLPTSKEAQHAGYQFYRAASAVEMNYRAAKRGRSTAEFISKLGVAVEEIDEAVGWLEHLHDGKIASDATLLSEAHQLRRIMGTSLGTARRNAERKRSQDQELKRSKIKRS